MKIATVEDALHALNNPYDSPFNREQAVNYLADHPDESSLERLAWTLQDDDFGVRWEASLALARLGREGLIAVLEALRDPKRIGDPRLRAGAYRVMERIHLPNPPASLAALMSALRGPAADITSMEAASIVLKELRNTM